MLTRGQRGAALVALVAAVVLGEASLDGDRPQVLTATGQGVGPAQGLTLSYLPESFALVRDGEASNPRGERARTLEYARPGDPASAHLRVTRLVGATVDIARLGSQPGFDPSELAGHRAVISRLGGRVSLQWVPAPTVVLAVHGGTRLSEAEVRRIAEGAVYDPALDDLRVPVDPELSSSRPGTVVAEGDLGAERWELVAYPSDHGLCVDLQYAGGTGGACGHNVGPGQPIGGGPSGGVGWQFVSGPIDKAVAGVQIGLDSGDVLNLVPVGAGAGFDVNFYVSPVPVGAHPDRAIALDSVGAILGEIRINRPPPRPSSVPV